MKRLLASLLIVASFGNVLASDMAVSLEDIVLLSQRGVSDETILVFLRSREIGFIPDADDIDSLLQAGASEEVIRYLLQQTASAPRNTGASSPAYIYAPNAYVDPYPAYYYTPYYTRTSLLFGFSTFPHTSFGHRHHGAVHHNRPHHTTSLLLAHNGHGVSRVSHGNEHGVTHIGGHDPGHRIISAGRRIPRAGHHIASAGHERSSSIGHSSRSISHSRSGRIGHSRSSGHGGGHSGGSHGGGH